METTTPEADAPMTATTTSSSEDSKLLESRRLRISINNNNNSVSNNSNANNTTNHSNHYQNDHQMPPVPPPIGAIGRSRLTEETSSDIHSAFSSDGAYEVIEYDFPYENNGGGRKDRDILDEDDDVDAVLNVNYFSDISSLSIQEDSPAAAALRANASVHVSSMGKVARAVHMQTVRRVLKRAAGKSTFGNIRGKPPRVPPKKVSASLTSYPEKDEFDEDSDEDEDDDDDDEVDDGEIDHDNKNKNSKREDDAEKDEIVWSEPMSLPSKQIEQLREAVNKCNIATGGHPWLEDLTEQNHSESCGGVGAMAKTETEKQQQHLRRMQLDKETMHIPDGVAPGTVEAGKKGACSECRQ